MFSDISKFGNRKCETADILKIQKILTDICEEPKDLIKELPLEVKQLATLLGTGMLPSERVNCMLDPLIRKFKQLSTDPCIQMQKVKQCKTVLHILFQAFQLNASKTFFTITTNEHNPVPILNERGVKALQAYYSTKKIEFIPAIFTSEVQPALVNELTLLRKKQTQGTLDTTQPYFPFITQYHVEQSQIAHCTPILVKISDEGWKFLITDSLPQLPKLMDQLIGAIDKFCQKHGLNGDLYFYTPTRQYDRVSCPLFSINDLIAFSAQKDIFAVIEAHLSKESTPLSEKSHVRRHDVDYLPAQCMKYTQQSKTKNDYLAKNTQYKAEVVTNTSNSKKINLEDYINTYCKPIVQEKTDQLSSQNDTKYVNLRSTYKIYKFIANNLVAGLKQTTDKTLFIKPYLSWSPQQKQLF